MRCEPEIPHCIDGYVETENVQTKVLFNRMLVDRVLTRSTETERVRLKEMCRPVLVSSRIRTTRAPYIIHALRVRRLDVIIVTV